MQHLICGSPSPVWISLTIDSATELPPVSNIASFRIQARTQKTNLVIAQTNNGTSHRQESWLWKQNFHFRLDSNSPKLVFEAIIRYKDSEEEQVVYQSRELYDLRKRTIKAQGYKKAFVPECQRLVLDPVSSISSGKPLALIIICDEHYDLDRLTQPQVSALRKYILRLQKDYKKRCKKSRHSGAGDPVFEATKEKVKIVKSSKEWFHLEFQCKFQTEKYKRLISRVETNTQKTQEQVALAYFESLNPLKEFSVVPYSDHMIRYEWYPWLGFNGYGKLTSAFDYVSRVFGWIIRVLEQEYIQDKNQLRYKILVLEKGGLGVELRQEFTFNERNEILFNEVWTYERFNEYRYSQQLPYRKSSDRVDVKALQASDDKHLQRFYTAFRSKPAAVGQFFIRFLMDWSMAEKEFVPLSGQQLRELNLSPQEIDFLDITRQQLE